jgi:hypothetical protein
MRHRAAWVAALLLAACTAFGQEPAAKSPAENKKPGSEAELTNLFDAKIKAEWEAIKKRDQKALGELLTDDFIGVEADGEGERYKSKALRELQESAVTDYTLSFLKVTPLCADAAFVRYEVFITFPPKSAVRFEKILIGEVWVKRTGQWKELHYQETRVK